MAGISFLAVYRELFEIVLFYQTLWAQAGPEGTARCSPGIAAAPRCSRVLAWASCSTAPAADRPLLHR
jgi:high-affinity iron transporter